MLHVFTSFCDYMGINPNLAVLVSILSLVLFGLEGKKLEYKVEDEEKKKVIKVYKYK